MKGKHRLEKLNHTWYLVINASIDGTSSPTNLSIVLYCDSSRVHAGEYLFNEKNNQDKQEISSNNRPKQNTHNKPSEQKKVPEKREKMIVTHSAAGTESRTYARSR